MINWENVFRNSGTFKNNKPFPFGFVENFLHEDFYNELYNTYPEVDKDWFVPTAFDRTAKKDGLVQLILIQNKKVMT